MAPRTRSLPLPPVLPSGTGKLLVLIAVAGFVAASLLVTRQQRVEASHELTTLHRHMTTNERALWELRAAIAERCRPEAVRRMIGADPAEEWIAIPRRRPDAPVPAPLPAGASAALDPLPPENEPGG